MGWEDEGSKKPLGENVIFSDIVIFYERKTEIYNLR